MRGDADWNGPRKWGRLGPRQRRGLLGGATPSLEERTLWRRLASFPPIGAPTTGSRGAPSTGLGGFRVQNRAASMPAVSLE